jgi:RIO kinase 1
MNCVPFTKTATCGDREVYQTFAGESSLLLDESDTDASGYDRFQQQYGDLDEETDSPRKHRRKHRSAESPPADVALTDNEDAPLPMTYTPSRFEEGWLASSLRPFYQQLLLDNVLYHVKGGKEANVYCGQAPAVSGGNLLAVKVYRPREFRNLRNDKMYREGRPILTEDGRAAKRTDTRLMRAIGKKTAFGVQAEHTSWLMYEFTTLSKLHEAGGSVPKPVSASENALLIGYCGDQSRPAPTLSEIRLSTDEAGPHFGEVLRNIRLMLQLDLIHGDLSAYNILYWEGDITLIDFPQVSNSKSNPHAKFLLHRDITRVCQYFAAQGVDCDADDIYERTVRDYLRE